MIKSFGLNGSPFGVPPSSPAERYDVTVFDRFDAISIDQLHDSGALKWAGAGSRIGAFVAEMDFGTAPEVTKSLHDAVDVAKFGYMPPQLMRDMQAATVTWLKINNDWDVAVADVLAVPDVLHAMKLAMDLMIPAGAKVIVPTPSYMPFLRVPGECGRELIEVPLTDVDGSYSFDLDGIDAAFRAGAKLLVLCNPFNPVGRVLTPEEMLAISEVVERHGGRVFSDEIWSPLIFDKRHVSYASLNEATANHTLTATSASKAFNLPGLKCAQMIVSNDADRAALKAAGHHVVGGGTANLGVVAAIAAFNEGRPWLDEVLAYLDRNRLAMAELVKDHLPGVRYRAPDGTYIGWLDFRDTAAAENPAAFFKQAADVTLTEGTACGVAGTGFARFILATPLPVIEQAISQMGVALRGKNSR